MRQNRIDALQTVSLTIWKYEWLGGLALDVTDLVQAMTRLTDYESELVSGRFAPQTPQGRAADLEGIPTHLRRHTAVVIEKGGNSRRRVLCSERTCAGTEAAVLFSSSATLFWPGPSNTAQRTPA